MEGQAKGSTWEHAAEWVLLLGVLAVAAVAILPRVKVPGWTLWTVEITGGLVAWFVAWAATGGAWFSALCGTLGLFLGGWTLYAEHARVWSSSTLAALIAGLVFFVPVTALAHAKLPREEEEKKAVEAGPDQDAEKAAKIASYEHMFRQLDCPDVRVTDIRDERAGMVATIVLPNTGKVTIDSLRNVAGRIEVILGTMPNAIQFEHGKRSNDVIMKVRERNVLAKTTELKKEFRASTINQPFAIGVQEDGNLLRITLRELHLMMVGTTGAGKSNLLNVIIAQLASMHDTLIWAIDFKGGRMAKAWVQAWAENYPGVDAPALDWIATTREEASLMMQAFMALIETRMNSGVGGSKIVPGPSMPQVVLVCDEMADILGPGGPKSAGDPSVITNAKFTEWAIWIGRKARSEAASSVWASQRGTADMGGAAGLKANCRIRVALSTATDGELQWIIPDVPMHQKRQLTAMAAQTMGVGLIAVNSGASQLTKFFYCDHPKDPDSETGDSLCDNGCIPSCPVYKISIEVGRGDRRPRMDELTAAALGETYADRWGRAEHLIGAKAATLTTAGPRVDTSGFEGIMRGSGFEDPESRERNPVRRRALEILAARGAFGAAPSVILDMLAAEGMRVERETLHKWLREWEEKGIVHNPDFGRWRYGPGKSRNRAA